jgi:NADH pyrophosphatase NudC (nudix superfamily)
MKKQNYVLGFILNKNKEKVLLLRKNRPKYQEGFLNGIGGKLENNENYIECMTRETKEEVFYNNKGFVTNNEDWEHVMDFRFKSGVVACYALYSENNFTLFSEGEDQLVEIHEIKNINYSECLPPLEEVLNIIINK